MYLVSCTYINNAHCTAPCTEWPDRNEPIINAAKFYCQFYEDARKTMHNADYAYIVSMKHDVKINLFHVVIKFVATYVCTVAILPIECTYVAIYVFTCNYMP